MAGYPTQLPLPMQQGYALQHQSPFTRTEMQSGRARQRRTFTSVPSSATVTWFFTSDAQCQLFEGWFRDNLGAKDGENWFDMPLQTPLGVYSYECRFADMYRGPTLVAFNKWQISATLEIRERPILPVDYATFAPEYIILSDIFDIVMNVKWPAYTFDYLTYLAAFAAFPTLADGQLITIQADENNDGRPATYLVNSPRGPSLELDFAGESYGTAPVPGPDSFDLISVW